MNLSPYQHFCREQAEAGRLRGLRRMHSTRAGRVEVGGRELVNFAGNDYLGLSRHPLLLERSREWGDRWGVGVGGSRLVCGNLEPLDEIEKTLARGKGGEAALVMVSGFQANASILPALLDRRVLGAEPIVFTDRLIHASLHHGLQAAGVRQIRFHHNDLSHLELLLEQHRELPGPRFIITESVFSMEGDRVDLAALLALKERHDAFLYLDEAHATGVLGPDGFGLAAAFPGRVDLVMGTFGKALGSFGAYVVCATTLREYLINRCGGFIYATGLPPPVLGAIDAALELLPTLEPERQRLAAHGDRVRLALQGLGFATGHSSTQIIPVLAWEESTALAWAKTLEKAGLLTVAIRPPTVPPGTSRLRLSLSAAHDDATVDALITAFHHIPPPRASQP